MKFGTPSYIHQWFGINGGWGDFREYEVLHLDWGDSLCDLMCVHFDGSTYRPQLVNGDANDAFER